MRIFLATWAEDNQGMGLTKSGCEDRLMSYWFVSKEIKNFLKSYVRNGAVIRPRKEKKSDEDNHE